MLLLFFFLLESGYFFTVQLHNRVSQIFLKNAVTFFLFIIFNFNFFKYILELCATPKLHLKIFIYFQNSNLII